VGAKRKRRSADRNAGPVHPGVHDSELAFDVIIFQAGVAYASSPRRLFGSGPSNHAGAQTQGMKFIFSPQELRARAETWFERAVSAEEEGDHASAAWRFQQAADLERQADAIEREERACRRAMQAFRPPIRSMFA